MRAIMKKVFNILTAVAVGVLSLLTACDTNEEQVYEGPSYIMFADTMNVLPVFQKDTVIQVPISATRTAPYDRTLGVEVLQAESNAIEGYHYTLKSNTVTIPAGQLATCVELKGIYDNVEQKDSLNIRMRLISQDDIEWPHYGTVANVRLKKICPFDINAFTGYAVVESTFLNEFKMNPFEKKRLIKTELAGDDKNAIILHDLMSKGFDIRITLDNSKPLEPRASVRDGDIIGTTQEFLNNAFSGSDNMLRISDYKAINSTFFPCDNAVVLYSVVSVKDVGNVGVFLTAIQWISDAEAEEILKNGF